MKPRGQLSVDPGSLEVSGGPAVMRLVVVHTEKALTAAVLPRVARLVSGLDARIQLLAVHAVPFPASFASASASHAHLVAELSDLAGQCPLPVTPQVVMARYRHEGFSFALQEEATVLVGTRKRLWRTDEERLAGALADDGHKVVLLRVA